MVVHAAVVNLLAWTFPLGIRMKCEKDIFVRMCCFVTEPAPSKFDSWWWDACYFEKDFYTHICLKRNGDY